MELVMEMIIEMVTTSSPRLHKFVAHAHLVKLFSYFEDPNFVYIVLELCRKR